MSIAAADSARVRLHPWLSALDSFDVPFLGYSARGALSYASCSMARVPWDTSVGLSRQAGHLVADALGERAARVSASPWVQLRAAPAAGAPVVLKLFLCLNQTESLPIAVVFSPIADGSEPVVTAGLSARQQQVARLIGSGASAKEVAARLGISVHTARRHVEGVYRRLGIHTRAEVARVVG